MNRRSRTAYRRSIGALVATVAMFGSAPSVEPAQALPSGFPAPFRLDLVADGLNQPTAVTFLPDGRSLVTEKTGGVVILDGTADVPSSKATYLSLSGVQSSGESGLLDIVLDPDFETNGHMYVFYTAAGGSNRVVRFTHQELAGGLTSRADPASAFVVWTNPNLVTSCCHMGGGLAFGSDGLLYITTGEDFTPAYAQDPAHGGGKIHRVARDGAVPADNPFNDGTGPNVDSVWAIGLRNPFRARWDTISDRLLIGTVGGNTHSRAWEDVHVGRSGANYGWPDCGDGPTGRELDGSCTDARFDDPLFTYKHDGGEASITGGVRYAGTAFPAALQGAYFYADFSRGWMRYLTFDSAGEPISDNPFLALPDDDAGNIVDIKEGPDGALYYVQIAGTFPVGTSVNACEGGCLRRVVYDLGNASPVITAASATPPSGPTPLAVQFTASADDADGDELTYTWDFGDGATATGPKPVHTYTENGPRSAVVTVSDGISSVARATVHVDVGVAPAVSIDGPAAGSTFRAGETLTFEASATDADGPPPVDYEWFLEFRHNSHRHPVLGPVSGSTMTQVVPISGHSYNDDTAYVATVTVTDSDGLRTTEEVEVLPDKVDLTLATQPAGLELRLDGIGVPSGVPYDTLIDFEHQLDAPVQCVGGRTYEFQSWSQGGAATQTFVVPDVATTLTATFVETGSCLPTDGLVLRLRGDDAVAADGTVTSWPDASGSGNHLAIESGAPTRLPEALGGHAVVDFDGIDDFVGRTGFTGAPTGAGDRTVILLTRYAGDGWGGLSWGSASSNATFGVGVADAVGAAPLGIQGWGVANDFASASDALGNGWLIQSVVVDDNVFTHFRDGTSIDSGTHTWATTSERLRLGVEIDGTPAVAMSVAEALVFDRALTADERTIVESHLQQTYLDVGPDEVAPSIAEGQTFAVSENAAAGTQVGTVQASDSSGITAMSITGGDPSGTFTIDGSGRLSVADPSALDVATTPSYTLTIDAVDGAGNVGTGVVTVSVVPDQGLPPGSVLHLEADLGVSVAGGAVVGWQDQSPGANHLVAAGGPTIGASPSGAPAVVFDGTDDVVNRIGGLTGMPAGSSDRSVFVVGRYDSTGYGGAAWGTPAENQVFGLGVAPPAGNLLVQGWGKANDFASSTSGTGTGWMVQSASLAADALHHRRDGAVIDSRVHTYATGTDRLVVGAEIDGSPNVAMSVSAVLVFDRALTATERAEVDAYLTRKYLGDQSPAVDTTPPVVATGQAFDVGEGATVGSSIGTVAATDDTGVSGFTIVDGDPAGAFAIGPDGVLTVASPLSATTPTYVLTVEAVDAAGNRGSASVTVTVQEEKPPPPDNGTALHLRADDAVVGPDGAVTSWPDASGSGNDLAVIGGAPRRLDRMFGPHAGVVFDGVDDVVGRTGFTGAPTGGDDRTVVALVRYDTAGWGGFSWGAARSNQTFGLGVTPTGTLAVQGWGTANDFPSATPAQGVQVHTAVVAANQLRHFRNGEAVGSATHTFATTADLIRLGAEIDGTPHVGMAVGEILVFDRALSDEERAAVEGDLAQRYLGGPTVTAGQHFELVAPVAEGGVVGTVVTSGEPATGFSIVGGDTGGAFAIDAAGTITVVAGGGIPDPATYDLVVEATDAGGRTGRAIVQATVVPAEPPVAGRVLHLVGDDALAGGSEVTSWADRSGLGNTLTPVGGAPRAETGVANGHGVVRFDGVDDALGRAGFTGAPTNNRDRTVTMWVRYDSPGWGGLSWGAVAKNGLFGVGVAPSGNVGLQGWGVANDFESTTPGVGAGWIAHTVTLTGGRYRQYVDGVLVAEGLHTYKTKADLLRLGAELDGTPSVAMSVAEAAVYDRALTSTELVQVESALRQRYEEPG